LEKLHGVPVRRDISFFGPSGLFGDIGELTPALPLKMHPLGSEEYACVCVYCFFFVAVRLTPVHEWKTSLLLLLFGLFDVWFV
jgi:hypothetical protein